MVRPGHLDSLRWLGKGLDEVEVTIDDAPLDGETAQNAGVVGYLLLR